MIDTGSPGGAGRAAPGDRRWLVLAVTCLALLVTGIDNTIVNVALPTLVRDLHASTSDLQWVVDGYTIIFASFLLVAGNTGDRLGRKGCFIGGLLVFGAGSLGCALVSSPEPLILMRGIEGLGAAFIMPATLSIITNVFAEEQQRAQAISIWAGVSGLGVAIGPLAGGFLLEHFWWGSVFLVNVPIVVVAVVAALLLVPDSRDENAPALDVIGTVLSTVGLVTMLYGIIEGPSAGWGSTRIVVAFALAVVLLTAFVLWERRTDHPIFDVGFFANPRFTAASASITLVFFAMFGSLFFLSQFLQFVLGYDPLQSGIGLLPVAGVLLVTAPASAKLVARVGTKVVVTVGLLLVAGGLVLFSGVTPASGYGLVAAVLVVIGAGMGLAMAPATDSIMGAVPPEKAGVGSAMNDTTREIGGALGVAILGSISSALYSSHVAASAAYRALDHRAPQAAAAVRSSIGEAVIVASHLPTTAASAVTSLAQSAYADALHVTVIAGGAVAFGGALVALAFLPARPAGDTLGDLVDSAALHIDPAVRRDLAAATLGVLADAGMSSLTYSGISARSGVGTATLRRYWTSRVDAVVDALREIFAEHPVPDTGDLVADMRAYLHDLGEILSAPRAREVVAALIAEAAADPELAGALRERVIEPRRAELGRRLAADPTALRVPIEAAADQLVGPLYHRAWLVGAPIDRAFVEAALAGVLAET